MWPSAHISSTHSILAPSSTVVAILIIPDILQDSVPLPELTANPSVLLSLRKGSKQAGTEQRTADWQLTCGSTETSISPSKHSYTDADSGTGEIILFPGIFKCFWVRGKDKWHNRCLWSLYTPTSESGNIMYQEL